MVGSRLKDLRLRKGLTQEEVAKTLGVTPEAIGMYENGRREPRGDLLSKLAFLLETTTDYLLGRTDDPMPPAGRKASEEPVNPLQKRLIELGVYLRTNKDLTEEDIKEIEDFIEYRRQKRLSRRNKEDSH